jgi:hypothetical protein
LLGEKGDILAKYRIPIKPTHVDYEMQLPEVSDSSNYTDEEKVNENEENSGKKEENNEEGD